MGDKIMENRRAEDIFKGAGEYNKKGMGIAKLSLDRQGIQALVRSVGI